jgi:AcrR family transcriptional regulator
VTSAPPTRRLSAAARREQLVDVAVEEFAEHGFHGTSTEVIARRAGVSQPYLFRLFGTKRELFLAVARRCHERTASTFRAAARGEDPAERLAAMGRAYAEMLADRTLLLVQMQMFAACGDPEIRARVREGWGELYQEIERLSGAPPADVRAFVATGMLLNVAAAMDLPAADGEPWARRVLGWQDARTDPTGRSDPEKEAMT